MNLPLPAAALLRMMEKWFFSKSPQERKYTSGIFFVLLAYLIHYILYCVVQPFYIEDAGISFAYARHFADGEGFVTYPGGERVEGFSNPLWTFLLSFFCLLKISPWVSSKLLGAIFGVVTLPFIYGITRRMKIGAGFALLAPAMLALSPQFVIWNACGLENSLYVMLLAWGIWRLLEEADDPGLRPWSALLFCMVAMTRPEGVMYALVAGVSRLIYAVVHRRYMRFVTWLLMFIIPFCLYHAWRMWYFSWPFPNTYYAKLGSGKKFQPFNWTKKGWGYIGSYLSNHGLGYALPLLLIGLVGTKGWRFKILSIFFFPLLFVVLWDGTPDTEGWGAKIWDQADLKEKWKPMQLVWIKLRVWSILGMATLAGLLNLGKEGWKSRSIMWAMGCSSIFFIVYSGGDWMKAHRWFNVVVLLMFPLLVVGLWNFTDEVIKKISFRTPSWLYHITIPVSTVLIGLALTGFTIMEVQNSAKFIARPETSVSDIHRRVRYMRWVQNRLDVDHITLLDVDMGAHMYYSGWDIVDIAGLVDVPMGQHSDFSFKFVREYIFQERKPEFAHVHGGWARTSRIPKHKEWKKNYLEIPGYPIGRKRLHVGNHIRRDLLIQKIGTEEYPNSIQFQGGVRLLDWQVPSPQISPGDWLYFYSAWQANEEREADIQALIAFTNEDGVQSIAAAQPGFRWYRMEKWEKTEKIEGKFRLPIPKKLPQGSYRLLMVLLDSKTGETLAIKEDKKEEKPPENQEGSLNKEDEAAHPDPSPASLQKEKKVSFLVGALDLQLSIQVFSPSEAKKEAQKDRLQSIQLAKEGHCEQSWLKWKDATRHLLRDRRWRNRHEQTIQKKIAACYLQKAAEAADRDQKIQHLIQARFWDHSLVGLKEQSEPLARELEQSGEEHAKKGRTEDEAGKPINGRPHWKNAYKDFALAMKLAPHLSWVRHRAEEARDKKLNIERPYDKKKRLDRLRKKKKVRKKPRHNLKDRFKRKKIEKTP